MSCKVTKYSEKDLWKRYLRKKRRNKYNIRLIVVKGGTITNKTIQIWTKTFRDNHPSVYIQSRLDSSTTHIVVPHNVFTQREELEKELGKKHALMCKHIVTELWVYHYLHPETRKYPSEIKYQHASVQLQVHMCHADADTRKSSPWTKRLKTSHSSTSMPLPASMPLLPTVTNTTTGTSSKVSAMRGMQTPQTRSERNNGISCEKDNKEKKAMYMESEPTLTPWAQHSKQNYACHRNCNQIPSSLPDNTVLANIFDKLCKAEELMQDVNSNTGMFKSLSFRKAACAIRKLPYPLRIGHPEDVAHLYYPGTHQLIYGIGTSIRHQIESILEVGFSKRLEEHEKNENIHIKKALMDCHGIGPAEAKRLMANPHNITSIDMLRQSPDVLCTLSEPARIGVKHYEDLLEKIPRAEVGLIAHVIRLALQQCGYGHLHFEPVGSYRRMKDECGDVDIIIRADDTKTRDSENSPRNILDKLIGLLEHCGFLTDHLVNGKINRSPSSQTDCLKASYMGICKLGDDAPLEEVLNVTAPQRCLRRYRRIDIKVYHPSIYAFALLYFTGDSYFNRSMRNWATKACKLSLSDTGFKEPNKVRGRGDKHIHSTKTSALTKACDTEEKIFTVLKIPYRAPPERSSLDAYQSVDPDKQTVRI
jgi:DNA polymerase/3'-5' exonuclease PolX